MAARKILIRAGLSPLDHSSVSDIIRNNMIGLRGERTMEYVQHLGLIPEKDATVIGCPSMYAFGPELSIREPRIRPAVFCRQRGSSGTGRNGGRSITCCPKVFAAPFERL